jgi:hypothetical protein
MAHTRPVCLDRGCSTPPNSVIPTGTDHRKAMIRGAEGPAVQCANRTVAGPMQPRPDFPPVTAYLIVPTFTRNVKVGQPRLTVAEIENQLRFYESLSQDTFHSLL